MLMAVGLYSVSRIDSHLDSIVQHSVVKANLANIMQATLRERAISMHSIAVMDDAFEKDEEFIHFNSLGFQFLKARRAMEQHPQSPAEKQVLANLSRVTTITQPLVTAINEKALAAQTAEERIEVSRLIYKDAIQNQKKVAFELDHLVKLQEDAIRNGTQHAHEAYKDARQLIWIIGSVAAVLGFIVAFIAVRNATRQAYSLQRQAMFDDLTSLPNRVLFQDRLQQAITVSRRENLPFSLLALDLNRFKEVNDTLGHPYGDLLLKQVAVRLTEAGRESDTIARMGGDEFSFLLPATSALGAEVFAKKIMAALEASFDLKGKSTEIGVSIGIAVFPAQGTDYETLMRHADDAMYVAKRTRSGYEMYDSKKSPEHELDITLKTELRRAIEQDQLVLYFQPKINHTTSKISGLEALVRWQHPVRGLIPPDSFIPLAEQTGLIRPLTAWVLEHAVRQCAQLHHLGMPLTMAVNLSTINLKDPDLPQKITAVLDQHKLEAKWLELEITESAVMDDTMRTVQVLAELDTLGARISIDDYGTGYSSLSYFRKLPLDDLKIDKSFVIGMSSNHEDATIVRSTIQMGHELGLRVVAEGVEDQQTWEKLTELGCDAAQGYYMARPLAATDLLKWLCESPWGYQSTGVISAID
jgi:diguanylate cyclase (GGDEF)-like protein